MIVAGPASQAQAQVSEVASLWITDDTTKTTYHMQLDGTPIDSFPTPNTAISSISVDPTDRTLWGANEGSSSGTPPGKIVNYDRSGTTLAQIGASEFGGLNTEGASVSVAVGDDTLWVVDDPTSKTIASVVYNVARDGTLLSSFPVTDFDPDSDSPQAVAYDPYSASLWLTDNSTARVYNVSFTGQLLSSFPTDIALFDTVRNVQGISVESADVLWMTARDTGRIYRITKSGDEVLDSFLIADKVDGAANPTGIAYDRPPGDLGAAADFVVLALPGAKLKMKHVNRYTGVVGDVGLADGATQDFDDGLLTGKFLVDPGADNSNNHDVAISGGTVSADLDLAVSDARFASLAASVLHATQTFGEIKTDTVIAGSPGLNVIEAAKIELAGEHLTLVGDASSSFVFNIATTLKLKKKSSIILQGGVTPNNVFFNVLGTKANAIESGSYAVGTILAPTSKFKINGAGSVLLGLMIGGEEIKLENGGRIRTFDAELAAGGIGAAEDAVVVALPKARVMLGKDNPGATGDVVLGPNSKQAFKDGLIDGTLLVDPAAINANLHSVVITGGTLNQETSRSVADAVDGSYAAARLAPDQTFGAIKTDKTISGVPGLNVISTKRVTLDNGEVLTLSGDASTRFVLNVAGNVQLKRGSSVQLAGGVLARNVVFNILGSSASCICSGSSGQGTMLNLRGSLKVRDAGSSLVGSLIAGRAISIERAGVVQQAS